jgi:hypothetical protein
MNNKCRLLKIIDAFLIFIITTSATMIFGADMAKEDPSYLGLPPTPLLTPALTLKINDSSKIYKLVSRNSWFIKFKKTNLFRGLSDDIGPLYFLMGQNFHNAWQGRLIDFLLEEILDSDPVLLHYFSFDKLVSPFGFTASFQNHEKMKLAAKIMEKSASEPIVQKMHLSENKLEPYQVQPLKIHSHRLSILNQEKCTSLSKDPRITVSLSIVCNSQLNTEDEFDATLLVNIREIFPQISAFIEKFLKLNNQIDIHFKYYPLDFNYKPVNIEWRQSGDIDVPSDSSMADIITILPSNTMFFSTLNVPLPENLSTQSITQFLDYSNANSKTYPYKPVTLASWKKPEWQRGTTHMTALIISDPQNKIQISDIPQLFSIKTPAEIKFDRICDKYVVITPYIEALTDLWDNCTQKRPTLSHKLPRFLSAAASSSDLKGLLYFNLATFLEDSFSIGVSQLQEKQDGAPEIEEAIQILRESPFYAYVGKIENKTLKFLEVP